MSEYLLITTANREHAELIARAREEAQAREISRARRDRRRAERRTPPRRPFRFLARLSRRTDHRPAARHA